MHPPRLLRWTENRPGRVVEEAVALLAAGSVVAHPTETVYGLAAAADQPLGYRELLRIKGGTAPRAFLLLFGGREELAERIGGLPSGSESLARAFWPGPLTLLFPAPAGLPAWWSGPDGDVAARVTPHPFCRALISRLGAPVLSTSANREGEDTPRTGEEVARSLTGSGVALVVDGGRLEGQPSTLLRWSDRGWSVLRPGPISTEAIDRTLASEVDAAR